MKRTEIWVLGGICGRYVGTFDPKYVKVILDHVSGMFGRRQDGRWWDTIDIGE